LAVNHWPKEADTHSKDQSQPQQSAKNHTNTFFCFLLPLFGSKSQTIKSFIKNIQQHQEQKFPANFILFQNPKFNNTSFTQKPYNNKSSTNFITQSKIIINNMWTKHGRVLYDAKPTELHTSQTESDSSRHQQWQTESDSRRRSHPNWIKTKKEKGRSRKNL